jgi:hypothetical protein
MRSPTEDKVDVIKNSFYEEPEQFRSFRMKILVGDYNEKVDRRIFLNH